MEQGQRGGSRNLLYHLYIFVIIRCFSKSPSPIATSVWGRVQLLGGSVTLLDQGAATSSLHQLEVLAPQALLFLSTNGGDWAVGDIVTTMSFTKETLLCLVKLLTDAFDPLCDRFCPHRANMPGGVSQCFKWHLYVSELIKGFSGNVWGVSPYTLELGWSHHAIWENLLNSLSWSPCILYNA